MSAAPSHTRRARSHHRRVIRRATPAVLTVARVERREIDVLDRIDHNPRQMVLRQPLTQRGGHQQQLLTITLDEVLSHTQKLLKPAGQTRGLRNSLGRKQASGRSGSTRGPLGSSDHRSQGVPRRRAALSSFSGNSRTRLSGRLLVPSNASRSWGGSGGSASAARSPLCRSLSLAKKMWSRPG